VGQKKIWAEVFGFDLLLTLAYLVYLVLNWWRYFSVRLLDGWCWSPGV
jgi:hypothetical protein